MILDTFDKDIKSQSLSAGTHLFCVYGDNWFQSVRYTLRCLVAVPQDTDCVETIKSSEDKLAIKKKYDAAKERLETDVKEITEFIQEREGAYQDYQDASALKYSHVQATARNTSGSAQNPAGNIPLIGGITGGIGKLFG